MNTTLSRHHSYKPPKRDYAALLAQRLAQPHVRERWLRDCLQLALLFTVGGCFAKAQPIPAAYDLYMGCVLPILLGLSAVALVTEVISGSRKLLLGVSLFTALGVLCQSVHLARAEGDPTRRGLLLCVYYVVGCAAMVGGIALAHRLCSQPDRRRLYWLALGMNLALYLALLLFGTSINGTRAWVFVGGVSIQLTELTRLCALIAVALTLTDPALLPRQQAFRLGAVMVLNGIFSVMISELGTLIILGLVTLMGSFLLIRDLRAPMGALAVCAVALAVMVAVTAACAKVEDPGAVAAGLGRIYSAKLQPRLQLLGDTIPDPLGSGYQYAQARKSLRLSRLVGASEHALSTRVPVEESDMVPVLASAAIGIVPFLAVILTGLILFLAAGAGFRSKGEPTPAAALSVLGCASLTVQTLIGVTSGSGYGLIIGMGIPFVSSGGTAILAAGILAAFILYASSGIAAEA